MGVNFRRTRRLVAEGAQVADALAQEASATDGVQARINQWQVMQAARAGMSVDLWKVLQNPEVTDVVISGTKAWVDRGRGLVPLQLDLANTEQTRTLAVKMAAAASQRLDDAQPIVDAVLPGPLRLHAVVPPLARNGTSISLRVLRSRPFSLSDLVASGTLPEHVGQYLKNAVEDGKSILIAGATGAGKTTLLATLLGLVSANQRIVAIEEVSELEVDHAHMVSLQARAANIEGEGAVGLEDLVRAAMRMRPDRLVLGECRGPEVREVLTALNTGHRGGMATIHANSVADVPARILALSMLAGMDASTTALMAASAFDLVVFLERDAGGRRFVHSVGQLRLNEGRLEGRTTWSRTGGTEKHSAV